MERKLRRIHEEFRVRLRRDDLQTLVEILRAEDPEANLLADSDRYTFKSVDELLDCKEPLSRMVLIRTAPRLEVVLTRDELTVEGQERWHVRRRRTLSRAAG